MPRDAAQVQFDTLVLEGGLFTAEWLGKVANFAAPAQGEHDYQVRAGFTLREEIALAWRAAQTLWAHFDKTRTANGHAAAVTQRFVSELLKQAFGFQLRAGPVPVTADGRTFSITHSAFDGTVPIIAGVHTLTLDAADARFGDPTSQRRRRSAFGLLQEYLNAQTTALWGIASNGLLLRVARDNASLTRPAWLEADLERLFEEGRFAEFSVLWLLLHATRFGGDNVAPSECVLERWREACRDQGIRARDVLRQGVEQALLTLGNGFLSHHANTTLREALASNRISTREFFQQLLRLVYRQIFLLTIEERDILHRKDSDPAARELYTEGYGLHRLRDRAVRRNAHDRHHDLWEGLKLVWKGVAKGEPRLALPALGGLFAESQCSELEVARLENRHLLLALFHLAWLRDKAQPNAPLTRVNWRDMGPEELGGIYESLLELVPQIGDNSRSFSFLQGVETRGNARKTSGSYYTPDSLVRALLDSALEPVVADRLAAHPSGEAAVQALLSIAVVDPACGSGHFLLAAARRIATHFARVMAENQGGGQPTPADYRHALRRVVGHCIYGVDLNPMAVELCKVSLWMEAVEPGLPLTFLDSHIQRGNALLGTTPALMANGIPDGAWEPIEGDDKNTASALKKRNAKAAQGQRALDTQWSKSGDAEAQAVARAVADLEAASDANPEALARKESQWEGILGSALYRHQKFVADAWCAAFVWPKQPGELADAAPTNELWRQLRDRQGQPPALTTETVRELAEQYRFFHWHLSFPQVFEKRGFDVVLGNPPWDSVRFNEEEFFAGHRPDIARAATASARKRLVANLKTEDPELFWAYRAGLREVDGINAFVRSGVRYPLCGVGRVNLFALFAEAARGLMNKRGRVGQILPSGIVSDDSTKLFFQSIVEHRQLVSFFDFENREGIFGAVHRSMKFGILTLAGARDVNTEAKFVFFATRVDHLEDQDRAFTLSAEDIALLNPATRTCPVFRNRRDAELTKTIYRRVPTLTASGWKLDLKRLINQSDDSSNFETEPSRGSLPLYEGKYFNHYEHRWATHDGESDRALTVRERANPSYAISPRYWYPGDDARTRFGVSWKHPWVLAWRDITNATNERTFIAAVIPSLAIPNTAKVIFPPEDLVPRLPALIANLGSFVFDFVARQKTGGTHMATFITEQLPVLPPETYESVAAWSAVSLNAWLLPRVLELTYTAWDLEPFARDVGYDRAPFRWDAERRFLLRCELDAAFLLSYGLSRNDAAYVLDTFPIVRKNDEKAHGEYRTKCVILEIYDVMAEAARLGNSYQTRLDPPPADPRVSHPDTRTDTLPTAERKGPR